MAKSAKYLVVGSLEAYSGKSAVILGVAHQLQAQGLDIAYGKPLSGDIGNSEDEDEDIPFIPETLKLADDRVQPTVLNLNAERIAHRLGANDRPPYLAQLQQQCVAQEGDLVILEGPGSLDEGRLFDFSLGQMANAVGGTILLVARYHSILLLDNLLAAKQQLGDRLLGVVINDVPSKQWTTVTQQVKPFLEAQGIAVFGILPSSTLLRSVSVAELVHQLKAEVLCRADRLDLLVESLTIGAMNVNSALKYFRQGHNMAVVTGGDRTDLQLAALETSTQCLILTGHLSPTKEILARAEEMEIPILSVDLDTLTTVEIIDHAFGQVRLHEPIKVECVYEMSADHVDCDRLLKALRG
ncbi:DRTGG domain-containing protein [Alkalinema sp. FACHB-956]|uniref:DRTGG domain-containing protein n=1 Tax=Alkalinema sp. FACHB-956 TaxID=2692768 RepID=UPI0016823F69|nr:phosphotransacetylase family protein [Alkalinema sp. FACHB-956]